MSDRELAQVTFAFRIFDHDTSTFRTRRAREASSATHMATLGVASMSAGSKTDPGGATASTRSRSNSSP